VSNFSIVIPVPASPRSKQTSTAPASYLRYSMKDGITKVPIPTSKNTNTSPSKPQLQNDDAAPGATTNGKEQLDASLVPAPTQSNNESQNETRITSFQPEPTSGPDLSMMGITKFSKTSYPIFKSPPYPADFQIGSDSDNPDPNKNQPKVKPGKKAKEALLAAAKRAERQVKRNNKIKIPTYKRVISEGFPALASKIGYRNFASNVYNDNRGKITLKEIEDAWEAALWSEFQKWNAQGMTQEHKMTPYYNVMHQIHNGSKKLLRELAKEEGRVPQVKEDSKAVERREESVDMEQLRLSQPVRLPKEVSSTPIKVPAFKKVIQKGFLNIPIQLGFQYFAKNVVEFNKSPVTLKQLEDAWESLLWTEFQKWDAGDMPPERKMTLYNDAVNQIHNCPKSKLLRELAEAEGQLPRAYEKAVEGRDGNTLKIKVPAFKKVGKKGFVNIVVELGFQRFAENMFNINKPHQDVITLKQLEDAWKELLWSEFQNWHTNGMSREVKTAWYHEAINQIYDRNTKFLKDLAEKEERLRVEEDREDSIDMEEFIRALPTKFKLGEAEMDDKPVPASSGSAIQKTPNSPSSEVILQERLEYHNIMRSVSFLPGYFDAMAKGRDLPFIAPGARLQDEAEYYWDADGKPLEEPKVVVDVSDEDVEKTRAEFKVEMKDGRVWIEDEDLDGDDSDDEAVKVGKGTEGKKEAVIDLTGDDMDIEEVVNFTAQATVKEDTDMAEGAH
jgi:hypothetical protein